jgi:transposase
MTPLSIRRERTPTDLRNLAKGETDARIVRRILAIANALDGMSRGDAARSAGMDRQTLSDWVNRYNAHGLDGLADQWSVGGGRPPRLSPEQKDELVKIVLSGPDREASGVSVYTRKDLVQICKERFGKSLSIVTMGRILRELGLYRDRNVLGSQQYARARRLSMQA